MATCSAFASFALLCLFLTYSAVFVGGGAKIFLPPGAGYPSNIFPSRNGTSLFVPFIHRHFCPICK